MHAGCRHRSVVGTVEDAEPSAFRKITRGTPQEIMKQLDGAGMPEAEDLAFLRIDPGHHVPDRPIISSRIHRLKISSTV